MGGDQKPLRIADVGRVTFSEGVRMASQIYAKRKEIVAAVGLKKGQGVADVGAGTGLFTRLFAAELGLVQAQLGELSEFVEIYRALGGGWQS